MSKLLAALCAFLLVTTAYAQAPKANVSKTDSHGHKDGDHKHDEKKTDKKSGNKADVKSEKKAEKK